MYKALYATAYYGLFRVGELTSGSHPIRARDVHIGDNKEKILFILHTSKTHWTDVKPQSVRINSTNLNPKKENSGRIHNQCPFRLLREYLRIRAPYLRDQEPFFVFRDRSPVRPIN